MTSLLSKRSIAVVSFALALGILTPSALRLTHLLFEHSKEKRCIAEGTKHIHEADFHCEFHDFTLVSKVFFGSSYEYVAVEIPIIGHQNSFYTSFFKPYQKEFLALRGPPIVSL